MPYFSSNLVEPVFFLYKTQALAALASPALNALPCAYLCSLIDLLYQDNVLFLPSPPLFTPLSKVIGGIDNIYDLYKHHKVIRTN